MNKYFIYCRKSSEPDERQALSNESQRKEMLEVAEKLQLEIRKILEESKSAKAPGRPIFNHMLEEIERGGVNGILVWHPDRLSRNPDDSAKIVSLIDSGKLKEVVTPSQTFRNNPMDKFMLGFFMLQAKFENDNKGVNVKRGLKTKAEKGWLPSGAKPGYMNDKYAEKGSKTIKTDPVRFSLIKKAWGLMLTGLYSPPQILKKLNYEWGYRTPKHKKIGGKPMARSQIYRMLIDPFYYGEFEYGGVWYKGQHEPVVTKEEFERVQILLGRKGRPKPKTHEFFATGLIRCGECGAMITAEEKWQIICPICKLKFASLNKTACPRCNTPIEKMIKPTVLHYTYYHCTKRKKPNCSQGWVEQTKLNEQIDSYLSGIQISERFKNWAIKYLNELADNEIEDRNAILDSLQAAYNDCVKRIDNLVKLKISPQNTNGELLSDDEFKSQKEALMKEKMGLEEKLKDGGERISKWVELSEKTFNFACYAKYWFANGDLETRKAILQGLGSNLIIKDKTLRIDLEKPLQFIEEAKKAVTEIAVEFEPKKSPDNTGQLEALWAENPSLLRGRDSDA